MAGGVPLLPHSSSLECDSGLWVGHEELKLDDGSNTCRRWPAVESLRHCRAEGSRRELSPCAGVLPSLPHRASLERSVRGLGSSATEHVPEKPWETCVTTR